MENKVNIKHNIIKALGDILMYWRTLSCIQVCIFIDDSHIQKEYKLKRNHTPEEFGRFLEDVNFDIDASNLVGIIIWYEDGSYSWASDEEDRIKWTYHNRPNPDDFNL